MIQSLTAIVLAALLAAVLAAPAPKEATLSYSGDDLAAGPGTMTIRCAQGDRPLWELDLVRTKDGKDVRIMRFDDLTDSGDFSYAPPADGHYDMFTVHLVQRMEDSPFLELHKGDDAYEYSLTEIYGSCSIVTRYRIAAATGEGTEITAVRALVNTSGERLVPVPHDVMSARLSLGVGPFDGRRDSGRCSLASPDKQGRRFHRQRDGKEALWLVTDNCSPRGNRTFNRETEMWCQATILKSAAAKSLGLVPGRTFRLDSDIIGYYPAENVGRISLDNRASYMDGLHMEMTPREWFGRQREDHNNVGLAVDDATVQAFVLSINIATK